MFSKSSPHKVEYDDECLELCIPNSPAVTNAKYASVVEDDDYVE